MTKTIILHQNLSLNPLILSRQDNLVVDSEKPNIFLGVGLCTPTQLSRSIPFDILGFLLTAEFIKKQVPNSKVFLLIGDHHAWLSNDFDKNKTKKLATITSKTIQKIITAFEFDNWHILLSSNIFPNTVKSSYEELEIRDVNHFFKTHHCGIKISWHFSIKSKENKTDEAHFDQLLNIPIKTVPIKTGFTFNSKKIHESPYICTDPNARITLYLKENPKSKLIFFKDQIPTSQFQAVKNHLKRVTILFEQLIHKFPPKTPLDEKIKQIINKIFI